MATRHTYRTFARRAATAAGIGIAAALAVLAYHTLLTALEHRLFNTTSSHLVFIASSLSPLFRLLVPVLGGIAAGALLWGGGKLFPQASRQPFSNDYLDAVRYGNGRLLLSSSLVTVGASLCVVVTGNSVGREGAMILLAALTAHLLARKFTPEREWALWTACGAAAGMSCAYHAPFMGYFFVVEVFMGIFAPLAAWPAGVAAAAAFAVTCLAQDGGPQYALAAPVSASITEYAVIAALSVAAGLLGPAYLAALEWAKTLFKRTGLPRLPRLALGGAIVGALSLAYPNVWGNGYSTITEILNAHKGMGFIAGILLCKGIAICAASGSGAPGGIFTPTLFIGAALGALADGALIACGAAAPCLPALVLGGMVTVLSAVTHAPIMAAVIACELTGNFSLFLPLLAGSLVATAISRRIRKRSIYDD